MYIPIFINKFRLVGLLDSGGDICIISKSEINKLGFTNVPPPREIFAITPFSEKSHFSSRYDKLFNQVKITYHHKTLSSRRERSFYAFSSKIS
jgi:hypothetical protein